MNLYLYLSRNCSFSLFTQFKAAFKKCQFQIFHVKIHKKLFFLNRKLLKVKMDLEVKMKDKMKNGKNGKQTKYCYK